MKYCKDGRFYDSEVDNIPEGAQALTEKEYQQLLEDRIRGKKYYLNGFFDSEIHGDNIPAGAVEVSEERYRELLAGQATGKRIAPDANGHPTLIEPAAPERADLIEEAKRRIDARTDAKILTGFEYQGLFFKLSLENQLNFKTECELRESLKYPHRIKALEGYYEVQSADDYQAFYLAGVAHIRECVEAGWCSKDALELLTDEEITELLEEIR